MDEPRSPEQDFWQEHSLTFLEMAFRTERQHRPGAPSGIGRNAGACGDRITMFVVVQGQIIRETAYELDGCMNTNACANAVAEMAEGRDLASAWQITPEMVAAYLQTLPPDHFHCAELAVGAFYKALTDYQRTGGKDWKAPYRRP